MDGFEQLRDFILWIKKDYFIMGLIFVAIGLFGVARTNRAWSNRGSKKLGYHFWRQRILSFFLIVAGLFLVINNINQWLSNSV